MTSPYPDVKYGDMAYVNLSRRCENAYKLFIHYSHSFTVHIIISGCDSNRQLKFMHSELIRMGIPYISIIQEKQSKNMYENALFSKLIIQRRFKKAKILLITQKYYKKNAEYIFKKTFSLLSNICE